MVNSWLMLCAFTKIFFSKYWHVPVYICCVSKACPISIYDIFKFRKTINVERKTNKITRLKISLPSLQIYCKSVKVSFYFPFFVTNKELIISIFFSYDCVSSCTHSISSFSSNKNNFLVCVIFLKKSSKLLSIQLLKWAEGNPNARRESQSSTSVM